MIDREIVCTRLSRMRECVCRLSRLVESGRDAYLGSQDRRELAEHNLRIAIEALLDIGNHVIATQGFPKPLRLADCITILGREEVLPMEFAQKILPMVGLRNRLVHLYLEINHERMYDILTKELNDFERFARYIVEYMDRTQRGQFDA